ncbi:uncharacterized protein LOC142327353 isoform X2 [Lycorma delicatula]|uniref:uncharacterized protein LOC142327353 isoform X2 n=1 Tax=Lycorma delicatula TaxID=130591 RepID=UPI003F5163B4
MKNIYNLLLLSNNVPPNTTLNTYIRNYAHLPGTKHMCNEGGCGACVVSVKYKHPVTNNEVNISVNSCLILVYACHGWLVTTVEGISNKIEGYNKIQTTLAYLNGTQCGYCTPGFVMNMFSLLESNKNLTMEEVEKSFSGHICRCTGYRPILDAFKSLAKDASEELKAKCADIEDFLKICPKSGIDCNKKCKLNSKEKATFVCVKNKKDSVIASDSTDLSVINLAPKSLRIVVSNNLTNFTSWYKVASVKEIFEVLEKIPDDEIYMFVAGNTAQGAYRNKKDIKHYIDLKDVMALRTYTIMDNGLHLGANMTLTEAVEVLRATSKNTSNPLFSYTAILADHIELIANVSVRNVGTIAGNLSLKRENLDFPSDLFLMFETVGASLQIDNGRELSIIRLEEYIDIDMSKKLISKVILPPLPPTAYLKTYKIMPRSQNAPGILNAGFLFQIDKTNNCKIISKPSIVFGGIHSKLVHVTVLESFLTGKDLLNETVLQEAMEILEKQITDYSEVFNVANTKTFDYRRKLAQSLFYRFVLSVNPDGINSKYKSGYHQLERNISKGQQDYSTDVKKWPINKSIPKIEALSQCAGESEYVNDIPRFPNELQGALVVTKLCKAKIISIDSSHALKLPGVVAFFSAKDIPGENTFLKVIPAIYEEKEELFCSGDVLYSGQPVGIIVADTREIALKAAEEVKINYANIEQPIIDVKDVINSRDKSNITLTASFKPELPPSKLNVKYTARGQIRSPSQYHFTMEPQSCLCVPVEGELNVYSATQWLTSIQEAISIALNIPQNKINMSTRRIGGGYGCKISRSSIVATACALASYITNRPVRLVLDIETNMAAIGMRNSCYAEYEVAVNEEGKIQYLNINLYEDNGIHLNEPSMCIIIEGIKNIYDTSTWTFNGYDCKTNKASTSWTRAPGTFEAMIVIETIFEHIASMVKKDSLEIRLLNADQNNTLLFDMIKAMCKSCKFKKRKDDIDLYNRDNRWKKKGISLIPMKFTHASFGPLHVILSVYARDGTVALSHGGIEMGQGINTKVAQVVAAKLEIPIKDVSVKSTSTLTSPNNIFTGASTTSENVCKAAITACDNLLERLDPVRKLLGGNPEWIKLINMAIWQGVDLVSVAQANITSESYKTTYSNYGVAVTEVEIDVLTGTHEILRTDVLEDAGQSISPGIDVGQVEGAFVMGLGLITSEELKYDEKTGALKITIHLEQETYQMISE